MTVLFPPNLRRPHIWALGLILGFALLRLWLIASGQLDLSQDEAQYWDWSRRPELSYYSKGPLIAWIIALWTSLFGATELGVRFGAVFNNALTQGVLYWLVAVLWLRPRLGVIALLIANTTPLFIAGGVLMTTDNPLLLCWVCGLACLAGMVARPTALWPFVGLALAIALGVLAKYMMLAFAGIALSYALILHRQGLLPKGHGVRTLLAVLVGVGVGMLPILLWNMHNDFASFRHVGRLAGVAPAPGEIRPLLTLAHIPEYLASQLGLVLPWWLGFMGWQGVLLLRECGLCSPAPDKNTGQDSGLAKPWALLLCLSFWPLCLFFIVWSFHTRIYPNWSAMSYAAGILIAALGVEQVLVSRTSTVQNRTWGGRLLPLWGVLSIVLCLGVYGQHFLTSVVPLPPQFDPTARIKGWRNLGQHLENIRLAMPNPDKVFFFSNAYDVTAALAFYLPGQPVVYCIDAGRRLNQYDFWPAPDGTTVLTAKGQQTALAGPNLQGWDAVFVTRGPRTDHPAPVPSLFTNPDIPEIYQSVHEGSPARKFGFARMFGFKGVWPHSGRGIY